MPIKVLLWDIDGTVLNFLAAEKAAIRSCFAHFNLGKCTDEMIARYSTINAKCWKMLEAGEITKKQCLTMRFEKFFALEGVICESIDAFNAEYQVRLGDTIVFNDNAFDIISSLKGRFLQYAVTNGTRKAQEMKLVNSGLDKVFDGVFISDVLGCEKPSKDFFEPVFEQIGAVDRSEIMIIGDSPTSDIRGGNNTGIKCCWYNPNGSVLPDDLHTDYEITNLAEIINILSGEN